MQVANSILWFAFLKAMYRATLGRWIDGKITFKVTAKGLQRIADLPIRCGQRWCGDEVLWLQGPAGIVAQWQSPPAGMRAFHVI